MKIFKLSIENKLKEQNNKIHDNSNKGFYLNFIVNKLEIRNLSFSKDKFCILKNVNISAKIGDMVGIVAEKELEKNILIKLLLKIYDSNPYNYALIDENENRLEGPEILNYIAYIPQTPQVINGTIIENIRDGNKNIRLETIEKTCNFVGVYEFIKKLPNGFESLLNAEYSAIPYNKIREIEIVKAILKNVPIMIIDKPNYPLNKEDKNIIEVIKKLSKNHIIFLVVYNDDIKKICNKIINLDNLENRKTFYEYI